MIKFTDPSYSDQFFVINNDYIYTIDKKNFPLFLEALEQNNGIELEIYKFKLNDLDEEEQHFRIIFDKLNTSYIKLLFHE